MPDRRHLLLGAAATAVLARVAIAQDLGGWPNRAVRIVVPFPPGGPTDIYGRLLAEHCARAFGQPFVVENRTGGTGAVGTMAVMRSPADGHTLLFTSISGYTLPVLLLRQPAFDPRTDFAPVSLTIRYPFYLIANPRFRSVAQLVEEAKARPGQLNFASPGVGSGGHFCAERFCLHAGIKAVHIPYTGAATALAGLAGGQVDFQFDSVGNAQAMVQEGRVNGLAITGARRMPVVPAVPTMMESGYPGFDADLWLGLLAPRGTPAPVIAVLNRECDRFLALPQVRQRLHDAAYTPAGGSPEVFARRIAEDVVEWGEVVRLAGMAVG
ncbi:MAG: tripartite tricarboxylate transporter substrate binding protein [Acetobacteraceae bacterium]|nr:tripartite tricarboxylate transporter substrate binding protein [Acetobacteraceae bacterium]